MNKRDRGREKRQYIVIHKIAAKYKANYYYTVFQKGNEDLLF